jgi:sec-independent protein translocase protein TatA
MPNIGPLELIFVLVIALLLLGPKRLPTAARALGRSIDEFRHGLTDQARDRSAPPRTQIWIQRSRSRALSPPPRSSLAQRTHLRAMAIAIRSSDRSLQLRKSPVRAPPDHDRCGSPRTAPL